MDICELIKFLCEDIDLNDNSNKVKVTYRLTRFFNGLSAFHVMLLDNIVGACLADKEDDARELYEDFKTKYPEVTFNKEGDSPVTNVYPGDIQLFAVDELYKIANKKVSSASARLVDYQIFYGKNLYNLKDIQPSDNYLMHRKLLLSKVPELNLKDFKEAERILKEVLGDNKVMPKLVGYLELSKYKNYRVFLEHFFIRVKALELDKDLRNPSNKEFIEILQNI